MHRSRHPADVIAPHSARLRDAFRYRHRRARGIARVGISRTGIRRYGVLRVGIGARVLALARGSAPRDRAALHRASDPVFCGASGRRHPRWVGNPLRARRRHRTVLRHRGRPCGAVARPRRRRSLELRTRRVGAQTRRRRHSRSGRGHSAAGPLQCAVCARGRASGWLLPFAARLAGRRTARHTPADQGGCGRGHPRPATGGSRALRHRSRSRAPATRTSRP